MATLGHESGIQVRFMTLLTQPATPQPTGGLGNRSRWLTECFQPGCHPLSMSSPTRLGIVGKTLCTTRRTKVHVLTHAHSLTLHPSDRVAGFKLEDPQGAEPHALLSTQQRLVRYKGSALGPTVTSGRHSDFLSGLSWSLRRPPASDGFH